VVCRLQPNIVHRQSSLKYNTFVTRAHQREIVTLFFCKDLAMQLRREDPLKKLFKAPLQKIEEKDRQNYHGFAAIIPDMEPSLEHACLAEIRLMGNNLTPWKKLPNGMQAGEFAFLYVHHFKERRRPPSAISSVNSTIKN